MHIVSTGAYSMVLPRNMLRVSRDMINQVPHELYQLGGPGGMLPQEILDAPRSILEAFGVKF